MRKSTFVLAGLASAAMVAAMATPGLAAHGVGSNSGAPALHQGHHAIMHKTSPNNKKFRVFAKPVKKYTNNSCDIDLSAIADGTSLNSVTGCKTTVTLSGSAWLKVSVPNFWGSWNCPPYVESCTPNALWSQGQSTATINFGKKVTTGGFELEPDQFQQETVEVDFYSRANGNGRLIGSITLQPNGSSGALLYGATSAKAGWRSAVITDEAGDDFAIAQVRV